MKEIKSPLAGYKHFLLEDVEYTESYYLYATLLIHKFSKEREGLIVIHRMQPEEYLNLFEENISYDESRIVFRGRLPEELHKDFLHMLFLEQKETRL